MSPSCEVVAVELVGTADHRTAGTADHRTAGTADHRTAGAADGPIERAGRLLRAGGLVAFPTETVYGLGADALDAAAVRRVFTVKQRPATDPLIVHLADADDVDRVVAEWPGPARELAAAFWPGPISLVVRRHERVPSEVTAGGDAVAVRVPAHPVARELIRAAGRPVAAPSANRFGRVSPTTAAHVVEELGDAIPLVLDGGPTPLGVESTVVDLTGPVPLLRRPGGVTLEDLRVVVPDIEVTHRAVVAPGRSAAAPGELLAHYSPTTPVVLVEAADEVREELMSSLAAAGVAARRLQLDPDPVVAARELYESLRAIDRTGGDLVLATPLAPEGLGRAVNDRLYRAAHGRIVTDATGSTVRRLEAIITPEGSPRS